MSEELNVTSLVKTNENKLLLNIHVKLGVIFNKDSQNIGLMLSEQPIAELMNIQIFFNKYADMPIFIERLKKIIIEEAEGKKK